MERSTVIFDPRPFAFLTVACVPGVSKNIREGNEAGKEQREELLTPPSFSPIFLAHPRRAPSLARFFARLLNLRLEKERNRLLSRLPSPRAVRHAQKRRAGVENAPT